MMGSDSYSVLTVGTTFIPMVRADQVDEYRFSLFVSYCHIGLLIFGVQLHNKYFSNYHTVPMLGIVTKIEYIPV